MENTRTKSGKARTKKIFRNFRPIIQIENWRFDSGKIHSATKRKEKGQVLE